MKTEKLFSPLSKNILKGICLMQLGFATTGSAQSNLNILEDNNVINNTHPLHSNININVPTGPNGLGNINITPVIPARVINVVPPVISNPPPKPQVTVTTRPVVTQAAVQRKSTTVARSTKPKAVVSNYKPKPVVPKTSSVARRPVPVIKPASQVTASATKPKPVVQRKPAVVTPTQTENKPVVAAIQAVVIPEEKNDNAEATPLQNTTPINNVITKVPLQEKTTTAPVVKTLERSVSISSGGSGLSKKSVHKSKHKSMKHLRYATNKKIMKLFAKTRKHKIDPARCFVWK